MKRCFLLHKWSEPEYRMDHYGPTTTLYSSRECRRCGSHKVGFYSNVGGYPLVSREKVYRAEIKG